MSNDGFYCDNCDCGLDQEDYVSYGSWSYTCPECGFKYNHSSELSAHEQVEKFNKSDAVPSAKVSDDK